MKGSLMIHYWNEKEKRLDSETYENIEREEVSIAIKLFMTTEKAKYHVQFTWNPKEGK